MSQAPSQLKKIAEHVHSRQRARSVPLRRFLMWFGARRRGYVVVREIRRTLKRLNLTTDPDFETAPFEGRIQLRALIRTDARVVKAQAQLNSAGIKPIQLQSNSKPADPTPRLGTLDAANAKPICVKRDAKLREALTRMLQHDFSQLPVMQNNRDVDGLISWKSIAEASSVQNRDCRFVRECMDTEVEVLSIDAPLWKAIKTIAEKNVVLVRNAAKEIVGLVTTSDIAVKYHSLAEPFLLLGEIENNLRQLIVRAGYPLAVLVAAKDPNDTRRQIQSVSDLTLAEYVRILQEPDNWKLIGYNLSRKTFLHDLDAVRKIRNEVMHFHPDPLQKEQIDCLHRVVRILRSLKLWSSTQPVQPTDTKKPSAAIIESTTIDSDAPPSRSESRKLRLAELLQLGRIKVGDVITIAGKPNSEALVVDAKTVRVSDGKTMTWNEYGQRFTGHIAVNIYKHAMINGVLLETMR